MKWAPDVAKLDGGNAIHARSYLIGERSRETPHSVTNKLPPLEPHNSSLKSGGYIIHVSYITPTRTSQSEVRRGSQPIQRCGEMNLLWSFLFPLLLATCPPSSLAEYQDEQAHSHSSSIRLSLHHALAHDSPLKSKSPLAFSDFLSRDEARVKHLNWRLEKNQTGREARSSGSGHGLFGPRAISTPLNPGMSIGVGNYFIRVGLGTPPVSYPVVVDTGSSFSWLQCQPCVVYCHPGPVFNPSASKTYRALSCRTPQCNSLEEATLNAPKCTKSNICVYTASYGDSSVSLGFLSQDSLSLAQSETLPAFVYGCGQDNEGLFGRSAGIFGLARHKLSMVTQLSAKYGYAFSYCLPSSAGGGGSLSIGSTVSRGYKFTPMLTDGRDPGLYFLRLTAIEVAGKPLPVSVGSYQVPTIIDSGTVISRLPMSVYSLLSAEFAKSMSYLRHRAAPGVSILDTCFQGSVKAMASVPRIRMVFQGGADLVLAPDNVLIDVEDEGVTCLAFAVATRVAIIGNHQQQTFTVAYDISNSRIGFAVGGCH